MAQRIRGPQGPMGGLKKAPEETADPKDDAKENIVAVVLVLLLVLGAGWWIYDRVTTPPERPDSELVDIPIGGSALLGNESANTTVIVFSDFECSFCGQFARDTMPTIEEEYVDTGRARIVFKHFPLPNHPYAMMAAQASVCAQEQGRFWEYHDLLFENQKALALDDLKGYAQELGLDQEEFDACLGNRGQEVLRDKRLGEQAGVRGTPTFFIDGRKVAGALSIEDFRRELDK